MDALLDRLAATPRTLAHLVAELSDASLDGAPAGAWSIRTVLAHLRDDEYLCMRPALERALAEDEPAVSFMDGADWEPARNRTRDRKEWLLADFALQRQATVAILRMLRAGDWDRTATRSGRRFTVRELVTAWAAHDDEHVQQLEALTGESLAEVLKRRARRDDA
jgi:hypothetical protein